MKGVLRDFSLQSFIVQLQVRRCTLGIRGTRQPPLDYTFTKYRTLRTSSPDRPGFSSTTPSLLSSSLSDGVSKLRDLFWEFFSPSPTP